MNPRTYGRYGHRQWAAPLPWTRVVIKDPFALLSVPAIQSVTDATVVVVYRHPAAVLASYRRMGWQPDLSEVDAIQPALLPTPTATLGSDATRPDGSTAVASMASFWRRLHRIALGPIRDSDHVIAVSHEEISTGGVAAAQRLMEELGLESNTHRMEHMMAPRRPKGVDEHRLHNLSRASAEASQRWRVQVTAHEVAEIEEHTQDVRSELDDLRLKLT